MNYLLKLLGFAHLKPLRNFYFQTIIVENLGLTRPKTKMLIDKYQEEMNT